MIEDLSLQYWSTLNSRWPDKKSKRSLRGSVPAPFEVDASKNRGMAICRDLAVNASKHSGVAGSQNDFAFVRARECSFVAGKLD
jgi:hypothetical protein